MKKIILFFMLLCSSAFALTQVELLKIVDGDTVDLKIEDNKFQFRLYNVECYEVSKNNRTYYQAYNANTTIDTILQKGQNAKNYVINLNNNSQKTYIEFKGIDKASRALGVLYFDDLNVNEELLNKGICLPYKILFKNGYTLNVVR